MKLGYDLTIEQSQKLALTPKMIQEIQILQYNAQELGDFVRDQLLSNPALENLSGEKGQDSDAVHDILPKEPIDNIKEYLKDREYEDISYREYSPDKENNNEIYDYHIVASETLSEHLTSQLNLASSNKYCQQIGSYIIDTLDENGYMTSSAQEIADGLNISKDAVKKVLSLIRTFEPAGVCARDLSHCLLLQIKAMGNQDENLEILVKDHLKELADNKIAQISKKMGITVKQVQELADVIKNLNPKPGVEFGSTEETKYIVPDIIIKKEEGEFVVEINDNTTPRIMVSSYYKDLLRESKNDESVAKYLNEKINSALWLVKCIEQRKQTILNVANTILKRQYDFFEKGEDHLKPLTLKNIAEEIGVHESTVSRAINGKHLQCAMGVIELKYFFSSGFSGADGEEVAASSIKAKLKEIIKGENPKSPLSDQKLSEMLTEKGFNISRRTVTKYRESIGIASSSKRRRF